MSNKLVAVCPACPITFTAKHRQQIREMLDDHLMAHYGVLEDVKKDKQTIADVREALLNASGNLEELVMKALNKTVDEEVNEQSCLHGVDDDANELCEQCQSEYDND